MYHLQKSNITGLHVALCAAWDSKVSWKQEKPTNIYYITAVIAYTSGLFFTAIALTLMETGQPALLYIVPSLLLTTGVAACLRGELKPMLRGKFSQGVESENVGDDVIDDVTDEAVNDKQLDRAGSAEPLT